MHSSTNLPTVPGLHAGSARSPHSLLSELMFHESFRPFLRRALVVGIVAAAAMLSTTQLASAAQEGPTVPGPIAVPAGNKLFLVGHASGVQIYACNNGIWGPASTPRATLVDDKGEVVATHFAGPTWQARDGSTVVGARVNGVDAPDPKKAIQWLLLSAKSTAPGPTATSSSRRPSSSG
jgi:hypothetical protein